MARPSVKNEAQEKQSVYCGPTIKGIANKNAVFIGELPGALKDAAGKCKAIQKLIIPIEMFPETIAALSTPGTPENVFFNKAAEYMKGVK